MFRVAIKLIVRKVIYCFYIQVCAFIHIHFLFGEGLFWTCSGDVLLMKLITWQILDLTERFCFVYV